MQRNKRHRATISTVMLMMKVNRVLLQVETARDDGPEGNYVLPVSK